MAILERPNDARRRCPSEGLGRFCDDCVGVDALTLVKAWRLLDADPIAEVRRLCPDAVVDEARAAGWHASLAGRGGSTPMFADAAAVSSPPMTRRLFTILSAVSLLLCAATCALWVRSYRVGDDVTVRQSIDYGAALGQRTTNVRVGRGGLKVEWDLMRVATPDVSTRRTYQDYYRILRERAWVATGPDYPAAFDYQDAEAARLAGFGCSAYDSGAGRLSVRGGGVIVPLWFPALLLTLPTAAALRSRYRRGRGDRAGLCLSCGYDLRASPGRCPECGAVRWIRNGRG
jgi:hypothetical protein